VYKSGGTVHTRQVRRGLVVHYSKMIGRGMVVRDERGRVVSGVLNPKGGPKKEDAITHILKEKIDKEAIAEKLIEIAMEKEDLAALKYIFDRVDGRPKETVEHQGEMSLPVVNMRIKKD